jgi:hypothetical protein
MLALKVWYSLETILPPEVSPVATNQGRSLGNPLDSQYFRYGKSVFIPYYLRKNTLILGAELDREVLFAVST